MSPPHINIKFYSNEPLPPKWAWWIATKLPFKVQLAVNLILISSSAALAEKGLDATFRDVMTAARGMKESIDWDKPTTATYSREPHNNISHCNAAGCDGTQCDPDNNHTKGDF